MDRAIEAAALVARLEGGETGPSIDFAIAQLLRPLNDDGTFKGPTPNYFAGVTTSLDAAVALVERVRPRDFWDVCKVFPSGNFRGALTPPAFQEGEAWLRGLGHITYAPTPAAALVAALLKAGV